MPKFSDSFIEPYQVGPLSPTMIDEMEREKKRRLREHLNNTKRAKKIDSINRDRAPELSDQMISDAESPVPMASQVPNMTPQPRDMIPMTSSQPGLMSYGSQPEYNLGQNERDSIKESPLAFRGSLPPQGDKLDSRKMLYDYLAQRRESEPEFQEDYRDLSRQAETGRVLNTFASGLGEMASMAGTLGGKRADTGDLKALPNAIYGAQRREADESLALRRLANQEQVSDIRLLRDLERGDLDALRTQKILADLNKEKQVPKTLPYFVPGDGKTPPKMVMMRSDGTVEYRDLPQGAISTAGGVSLGQPITVGNKTVYPRVNSKTGQVDYLDAPEGAKTEKQTQLESQEKYREAELEFKRLQSELTNANAAQKLEIDKRMYDLKKSMDDYNMSKGNRQEERKDKELEIKKSKAAASVPKLTEFEKKSALQGSNARFALKAVEQLENGDPLKGIKPYRPGARSVMAQMAGGAGGVVGNRVLGDQDRLYETASNQLVEMLLRNVTGAAAQKDEIKRMLTGYKVQSGDDEKTIAFKQQSRANFVEGILKSAQKGGTALDTSQSGRKPLREMTREEKLRELEEHEAGGR